MKQPLPIRRAMSHEERHSRGSHQSSERRHYGSKPYPSPSPERRPHSSDSPDKAYRRQSPGTSGRRTPGDRRRPRRPDCAFCKGGHNSESCQNYPSAEDRRQVLMRYGRCFRCFEGGHASKKCPIRLSPCRHCKGIHNSALCNQHYPRRERRPETPELVILDDDEPIGDAPLGASRSPSQPLRIAEEAYFNVAPSSPSSSESELQIDDIDDRDSPSPTQEAARPTVSTKSSNWKKFLPPLAPCGIEDEPRAESLESCSGHPASSSFDVADEWNSSNDKSIASTPHVGGSSSHTPREPNNRERRTSETVFSEKPPDEERSDLEKERLRLAQIKLKLEEDKLAIQGQQQALLDMEADLKRDEEDLRAGNAKVNSDKATLEADRKQLEDERKELKQALSDQQSTLAKWSEELEAQQKRADEREKELNERQTDIESSEKEFKEAQGNFQADQIVLINDQSALRVKETKLEADLAELNNLAEALKTAQEEHEQAQTKLAFERTELERERAELHKERPECSGQEQPADQADELAATKAELSDLKTLFTQQSAVLVEAHRRLADQFDKRRRLRALLLQSEADGEHCQAEKEALQLALEFREQLHKSHEDSEKAAKTAHPTAPNTSATASASSSTTLGKRPHPTDGSQSAISVKRSRQPWDSDAVEGLKLKLAPLESHFTESVLAKGIEFISVSLLDGVAPLYELLDFLTSVDPTMSAFAERARELV
ncbi:Zinc knuckle family protein [Aphelenchoides avenae]|nr:Zinc knuckle family protein [Aphelenchus avenae]